MPVQSISRDEWGFSSVPEEELPIAVWWEHLRTIPEVRRAVCGYTRTMAFGEVATAHELARTGVGENDFNIATRIPVPFCEPPEWPRLPFMRLAAARRHELCGWRDKHDSAYQVEYDLDDLESSVREAIRDLLRAVPAHGVDPCVDLANHIQMGSAPDFW